jgi:folate-binding protein YgfZ
MQIFAFPDRQLIQLRGNDVEALLQRIFSQDISLLDTQPAIYSCLFTPQGRYFFDFIIFKDDAGHYYIDTARAQDLIDRLDLYKMRADVSCEILADKAIYASFEHGDFADPRHSALGHRLYDAPEGAEIADSNIWHKKRISLGVFDGEQDAELERSTADELHINKCNGIDWKKGCYIGQELTARMRYRKSGKKHLHIVEGENLPENGEKLGTAGIMRSKVGTTGLALLRDDDAAALENITATTIKKEE